MANRRRTKGRAGDEEYWGEGIGVDGRKSRNGWLVASGRFGDKLGLRSKRFGAHKCGQFGGEGLTSGRAA